jgi:hypothetical protein
MSDAQNWPKEYLTEFINIYKSETCLWKIKSKEYSAGIDFLITVSLFQPTFLKKESEAYEIASLSVRLSVCVSPLITFEPIGRFYEIQ